ncbi:ribonuclease H-like domain-containing protein [Lipomyces tetrasporus]|uniref:poly(A)-specific ribonuclease n=1 Tax=Lipomyces tetrasporus TaxID=54092 RepID=A0AAD7QYN3_9ASCO|nr:ribonuclease H-like domain-containing protein [Lipomyces tetrasporus]KAJ8103865.1 ribonuclease H-like domain-containing protein [Lipomyces tetrasporus]
MVPAPPSSMPIPLQSASMLPRYNNIFPGLATSAHSAQMGGFAQGLAPPPLAGASGVHQGGPSLQQQQQQQQQQHNVQTAAQTPQLQQQQAHGLQPALQQAMASPQVQSAMGGALIREVWQTNFEQEMHVLRELVERYNYISLETEFPGIVARPIGSFKTTTDYHYQTLRCNVDLLHAIQLGITFADEHGNHPEGLPSTWQFNFKFNLSEEMYSSDSIDILTKSGVDFKKHEEYGIDASTFAELFISSGLVLEDGVKWISYHSGYDFGYLISMMMNTSLPEEEEEFLSLVKLFFPSLYDVKYIMRSATTKNLKGGLQELADDLRVARVGPAHHAGSEALLTNSCFFELQKYIQDAPEESYQGMIWGLVS